MFRPEVKQNRLPKGQLSLSVTRDTLRRALYSDFLQNRISVRALDLLLLGSNVRRHHEQGQQVDDGAHEAGDARVAELEGGHGEDGRGGDRQVVHAAEVVVRAQTRRVEVQAHARDGADGAAHDEHDLVQLLVVEGVEGLVQVEAGRRQQDEAEDVAVVLAVDRVEARVRDAAVKQMSRLAHNVYNQPEIGRSVEL